MYRVVKGFFDTQDGDRWYDVGDPYPRDGYRPTEKRVAELAGIGNRQRTVLIGPAEDAVPEEPERKGPPEETPAQEAPAREKTARARKKQRSQESAG